jgi:transcriptional regulator with XRE-family HTH domain
VTLAIIRKNKKLTQSALAKFVGVKRESIARYESGDRRPSPAVAEKIAEALGMDIPTMWGVLYGTKEEESA